MNNLLSTALNKRDYVLAEKIVDSGVEVSESDEKLARTLNDIPLSLAKKIHKNKRTPISKHKARSASMSYKEEPPHKEVNDFYEMVHDTAQNVQGGYSSRYKMMQMQKSKKSFKPHSLITNKEKPKIDISFKMISSFYEIPFNKVIINKNEIIHYSEIATLYKGTYLNLPVCIKHYRGVEKMSQSDVSYIKNEIAISLSLRHPNIITYIGLCEDKGDIFLISEYSVNNSLKYVIERKLFSFSFYQKVKIAYEISLAIYYLHSLTPIVYHRDLKSSNVLLDENCKAKLCDFGNSKYYSEGKSHSTLTQSAPYWMAPEYVREGIFSDKCDIYSFAVLMWEIFMEDTVPFKNNNVTPFLLGEDSIIDLRRIIIDSKFEGHLEIKELIVKCWDKEPNKRPKIKEVVETLSHFLKK